MEDIAMTEKIMQCCYTNAIQEIGGKISSGWQPVAVSDNIPSDAYNGCVSLQNANSTIQSHMVDERGNVLNLYEITGDGSYVYVSRTQYGLVDRLGRPNMFSHAYIFSWKQEDIISDPNVFLALDKKNFVYNEEDAKAEKSELIRTQPLTLSQAIEMSGLTAETFLTLIQCVYSQYSEKKAAKPLYIQYNGSEEQMQAILYCVFYALPHYIRRNLSIASTVSNTSENKNIIFSECATKHDLYFVPQTGENNLLTQRTERRIARFGFVDYAARNFAHIDVKQYFLALDKLAMELGDATASSELVLKIAHQMIEGTNLGDLSEEELDSRLSDALRSRTYGSQRMEEHISEMLDEVRMRKMFLTEENEANLADRLASPTTNRLADAGEQYNIYRFSTLSVEKAARMLTNMAASIFARYSQTLAKTPNGLQILDYYYAEYSLLNRKVTWNALFSLLEETSFMTRRSRTIDMIDAKAWGLYYELIERKGEAISAYNALIEIMDRCGVGNKAQYEQAAREAYWEKKSFGDFSFVDLEEYKALSVSTIKCKMFAHLFAVLEAYENGGEDKFLALLNAFYRMFHKEIDAQNLTASILEALSREVQTFSIETEYLTRWMHIAVLAQSEGLFNEIILAKNALRSRSDDAFIAAYLNIQKFSLVTRNSASLMKALSKTMMLECDKLDNEDYPIRLDTWVLLGSSQYTNCFDIFDTITPHILQSNGAIVVMQSKLFTKAPYASHAEEYAQSKGTESKTVRKWLNEVKAIQKRKIAEEKKARTEGESRGFPFLSRGTKTTTSADSAANREDTHRLEKSRGGAEISFDETPERPGQRTSSSGPRRAFDYEAADISSTPQSKMNGDSIPNPPVSTSQRGFTQLDPHKQANTREESKRPEKKGFFKDIFGKK